MNPPETAARGPNSKATASIYTFGPFQLDPEGHELLKNGEPVSVHKKAFQILRVLVENSGRIVSKDDLMKKVWGDAFVEEANLPVQISTLRKSLGDTDDIYIRTVSASGS